MPLDLKQYYAKIKKTADSMNPSAEEVDVISIENPERSTLPGAVSRVSRWLGAKLIIDRTHRLATPEEVAAENDRLNLAARVTQEKEKRRAPLEVIADRLSRSMEIEQNRLAGNAVAPPAPPAAPPAPVKKSA